MRKWFLISLFFTATSENWIIFVRFACLTVLLLNLLFLDHADGAEPGRTRASFAHSGGVYASGASGGVFGELNAIRADPDTDINERLQAARDEGLINIVQLSYAHRWNGDKAEAITKLEGWLARTDLSLVDGVHLSEEQPYNAARWLDPLYDVIKAHAPTLPVYVWPSFPMGPIAKADGYVYDAYGDGYAASRERFMPFLRTGKPLIVCVDASGFSDYRLAREQFMVCHEFDIPVFYFAADSGSGSVNNWYGKSTTTLAACRNFMFSAMEFQRRCRGTEPLSAGDLVWGEQIELAPDETGTINFAWTDFGPATVFGFTRLGMEELSVRNTTDEDVALDYQFWSELPMGDARLTLDADVASPSLIQVEYSRCGKLDDWKALDAAGATDGFAYDLGTVGQEFRVRVTLGKGAVLRGGRLAGTSEVPADGTINLDTHFDGWRKQIRFRQNLDVGLWRAVAAVDNVDLLSPGKALALKGKKGHGIGVSVVEKFSSAHPIENIQVRLSGKSHSSLGGSFFLGISLDGKTILKEGLATTEPRADGLFQGTHALDAGKDTEFQGVRTFYVHMTQKNNSGIEANTSSELEALEIEATRGE